MKKNGWRKYAIAMMAIVLTAFTWIGAKQVAAAVQNLDEITAYYVGDALEVGEKIDIKDVYVTATYTIYDGYTTSYDFSDVKTGFTLSPATVLKEGTNEVVVTYRGKSAVIHVEGKVVDSITAHYTGKDLYVGTTIPKEKFEVYAYFSDGSYEKVKNFNLSTTKVDREGLNTITVVYGDKIATAYIYGIAPLAVEEITAYYVGEPIIAGNTINKKDIEVMALYNDGTVKEITNFNVSPSVVQYEGANEIIVSYGEISTIIEIYGLERYIEDMTAKYIGPGVTVGEKVDVKDIEVTVTYNDGSTAVTKDFGIYGEDILWEGENVVLVYLDSFSADVVVPGVKGFSYNFDNCISEYFVSADNAAYTEVTLGMNMWITEDKFTLRALDQDLMKRVVQRVVPTEEFIAFEVVYDDDEMILEFPMSMKVSVPSGYDPENFAVYYTPNQETIMAKVEGKFVDETRSEFQFVVYEPGAYVVVHEVPSILVTDIIVEEEIELRVNRNFSLNPVVFPLNAENKEVSYWSSDEAVATVSEKGKIRTHSEGTCEIWIEAEDESGVYVIVTVEVSNN